MTQTPLQNKIDELNKALRSLEAQPQTPQARQALDSIRGLAGDLAAAADSDQGAVRLAALYQVSRVLGASLDLDQVLEQVMDAVIGLTRAERGFLVLIEPGAADWRMRAARNFNQETLKPKDMEVSRTVIEEVLRSGQGLITSNAQADPRFSEKESVIFYGLRSILCTPLLLQDRAIGAIYVDNRLQAGLFSPNDLEMLSAFAAQASIALENARLYTQTDRQLAGRNRELETLAQIGREMNASLDLGNGVETVRKWAARVCQAERLWVLLKAGDEGMLPVDTTDGEGPAAAADGLYIFPSGQPIPDLALVERVMKDRLPLVATAGDAPAQLAIPLLHSGRITGALLAERSQAFSADDVDFLSHLAGRAAAAFENARLYQAVQQANQAKTKFISVVTHELRIPMTSIKGYTDLLLQGVVGPVNEMQVNFLNVIRNNVGRMNTLVSDLADISRIETGRLKIECRSVDVPENAEEVLRNLGPKLEEKRQTLELAFPPGLPAVYTDPSRLVQVLTNLLSNACKYTPEGGRISLSAETQADGVRITVTDTGIGISPEDQAKLFNQFFRSDDPKVRDQQGWGLGLNVTRRLVELMGGKIGFESALGQGSTFWLRLPVTK